MWPAFSLRRPPMSTLRPADVVTRGRHRPDLTSGHSGQRGYSDRSSKNLGNIPMSGRPAACPNLTMSDRNLGYTADGLLGDLVDARRTELELLDGLTEPEMLGTRAHFVEPPIWEVGHVGWFQEYWITRHLDGQASLLPG